MHDLGCSAASLVLSCLRTDHNLNPQVSELGKNDSLIGAEEVVGGEGGSLCYRWRCFTVCGLFGGWCDELIRSGLGSGAGLLVLASSLRGRLGSVAAFGVVVGVGPVEYCLVGVERWFERSESGKGNMER